jgi:hypothetical protein
MCQATKTIQFTIVQPDDLDEDNNIPVFSNESGKTFYLETIKAWSDTDNADFGLYEHSATNRTTSIHIASVTISLNGTGIYYAIVGSSTLNAASGTINDGEMISFNPTTDDVQWIKVTLIGYYGADD